MTDQTPSLLLPLTPAILPHLETACVHKSEPSPADLQGLRNVQRARQALPPSVRPLFEEEQANDRGKSGKREMRMAPLEKEQWRCHTRFSKAPSELVGHNPTNGVNGVRDRGSWMPSTF